MTPQRIAPLAAPGRAPRPAGGLSRLPPLTALRAFVATARHLSFAQAAAELHVTRAAVGQQIRQLEDHIGAPLFRRRRGALELTEAGAALTPGLTEGFQLLLDAIARATRPAEEAPIRLSAPPSFVSRWLVPRLDALRAVAPELRVAVDASAALSDFAAGEADCVIRYGAGPYPGLAAERLFDEALAPVCSPAFARAHGLHAGPAALAGAPLLHEDGAERDPDGPDWARWLRAHGLSPRLAQDGIRLGQSSLVLDAAAAGMGIGLGKLRLAEADLAAGRLVSPFGAPWPGAFSYRFLAPPEALSRPGVARFRNWLLDEARSRTPAPPRTSAPERTAAE